MVDIKVPSVGESISSGILALWLKKDGDFVDSGEELFELETDKATMAIPSPSAGVLHIAVEPGKEIEVGSVVGTIDEAGNATAKVAAPTPTTASSPADSPTPASAPISASPTDDSASLDDLTPAVRKLVVEKGIDPKTIKGTGPGGRILKEDVLKVAATGTPATPAAPIPPSSAVTSTLGTTVPSTGSRQQRRIPMTPIRKKIAERLVASKQGSAHLTTFNEVDMSRVMALRSQYKEAFEKKHGVRLGFMSFYIKAAQKALSALPEVNAFLDGTEIVYNDFIDIGVAMSTDRGLITPVLRDVQSMGFAAIERGISEYGEKAKAKRIMPNDLMGGTFTVSNGGVFGSMLSTPIPNPPQTAVLGMHTIQDRPVVRDGQIVIRPMMYLALTYDHRMIDGKDAIGFLKMIKELIEDPARMVLDV